MYWTSLKLIHPSFRSLWDRLTIATKDEMETWKTILCVVFWMLLTNCMRDPGIPLLWSHSFVLFPYASAAFVLEATGQQGFFLKICTYIFKKSVKGFEVIIVTQEVAKIRYVQSWVSSPQLFSVVLFLYNPRTLSKCWN